MRRYNAIDRLLMFADRLLEEGVEGARAVPPAARRANPAGSALDAEWDPKQRRQAAGLMRVNHAGEVAAQALYRGQAAASEDGELRGMLLHSAGEEVDHLAWCRERLRELGSRPSWLDPLWFWGSWLIGAAAGLSGRRYGLGFVVETERQVEQHLQSHLERLPKADLRSRKIVLQMQADEAAHADAALRQGAVELPLAIKALMRHAAKIMTSLAYRA